MLTAFYYDRLISLNTIDRQELQKIYEAGKNGFLACSVCGEAVKLYLGLKNTPYFYHYSAKQPCMTESSTIEQEQAAAADIDYEEKMGSGFLRVEIFPKTIQKLLLLDRLCL